MDIDVADLPPGSAVSGNEAKNFGITGDDGLGSVCQGFQHGPMIRWLAEC